MTTTNIKLHFFKTTLTDRMNINGEVVPNAFNVLKQQLIAASEIQESIILQRFNIFLLLHLGHMAISFPDSVDTNIYGFGPKITKAHFINAPDQIMRGYVFPAWTNPFYVFSPNINLEGMFTNNNDFFNYLNKEENRELKAINYDEIDLQINYMREEALQKLVESVTYYGYPPDQPGKENCISYIFNVLKPTYIGYNNVISLKTPGHLASNLEQLKKEQVEFVAAAPPPPTGSSEMFSSFRPMVWSNPSSAAPDPAPAAPPAASPVSSCGLGRYPQFDQMLGAFGGAKKRKITRKKRKKRHGGKKLKRKTRRRKSRRKKKNIRTKRKTKRKRLKQVRRKRFVKR